MKKGVVCQHFRLECCIVENIRESLFQEGRGGRRSCYVRLLFLTFWVCLGGYCRSLLSIYPVRNNAPLEFLTGFTFKESPCTWDAHILPINILEVLYHGCLSTAITDFRFGNPGLRWNLCRTFFYCEKGLRLSVKYVLEPFFAQLFEKLYFFRRCLLIAHLFKQRKMFRIIWQCIGAQTYTDRFALLPI